MSAVHRAAGAIVLTVMMMLVLTPSAWAHAGGLSPTGVRSVVVSVSPAVPGLSVSTIEDGARLLVHNDTGRPVEIPPSDVQTEGLSIPAGESRTWIDSRASSLGRDIGPARTAPWSMAMTADTVPVTVTGEFLAEPAPSALLWWGLTAGISIALVVVAKRIRRPEVLLAVAGLVTVIASFVHVVGATLAVQSAPLWGAFLDATGIGLLVWPMVALAALAALRGSAGGVLAVSAGAGLSVVFLLSDITEFHYGVLPFAGPPDLSRVLVAVVLGVGSATAVAGAGALRALAQPESESLS
ncbi:MAG: hypothetical protein U1C73_09980 [Dietzia sp.]|nr:hypothetical protein [Dietzia sp.]